MQCIAIARAGRLMHRQFGHFCPIVLALVLRSARVFPRVRSGMPPLPMRCLRTYETEVSIYQGSVPDTRRGRSKIRQRFFGGRSRTLQARLLCKRKLRFLGRVEESIRFHSALADAHGVFLHSLIIVIADIKSRPNEQRIARPNRNFR